MQFDKEVQFESFWLRLHRSSKAYIEKSEGTRTVQVYLNSQVVAETTFLLTSDEWVLVRPAGTYGSIIGDTLIIEKGTDIDSIVVSWGDSVKHGLKLRNMLSKVEKQAILSSFQAWRVVESTDKSSEYGYSIKMAHIVVHKNQ